MSYCRFSSMNWMCDVYVYEDCGGGWVTHVAGRRRLIRPIHDILDSRLTMKLFAWSGGIWDVCNHRFVFPHFWRGLLYRAWSHFCAFWHRWVHLGSLALIPLRPIKLEHAGDTLRDDTAAECADRLEELRRLGYTVPQYAIDELRSE